VRPTPAIRKTVAVRFSARVVHRICAAMPRSRAPQEQHATVAYWLRIDVKDNAESLGALLPAVGLSVGFCYPEGSGSALVVVGPGGPPSKASTAAFRQSMLAVDRLLRERVHSWHYSAASPGAQAMVEEMRQLQWAEACREPEARSAPADWQESLTASVLNFLQGDGDDDL